MASGAGNTDLSQAPDGELLLFDKAGWPDPRLGRITHNVPLDGGSTGDSYWAPTSNIDATDPPDCWWSLEVVRFGQ